MADDRTISTLRRRKAWKIGGFTLAGGVLGLVLKLAFEFEPVDAFFNTVQTLTGWFPPLKQWLEANPEIRGWVVGPAAFGLAFFALASLASFRRGVLDRLLPDPPSFVRSDLDEARRRERMISLEGPPLPFVGRVPELAELDEFLREPKGPFGWRAITGSSGIGKTRLGIEWLHHARSIGWDVGFIDKHDIALVKGWRPRRPTALVVDEARRDWTDSLAELLVTLARTGSAKRPVRLVLIDQMKPFVDIQEGDERHLVREAEHLPLLQLSGLGDADMGLLRKAARHTRLNDVAIIRESAGRPRAALILMNTRDATSYAAALGEWAERYVPGLGDPNFVLLPSLAGPLLLAALAGPVDTQTARELFGPINVEPLARYYPEASRETLERQLPPLRPDDLANELVLRLVSRLDAGLREAAVDRMLADAGARVEARLGDIWHDRSDLEANRGAEGLGAALYWLQARFDAMCPERVAFVRENVRKAVQETINQHENADRVAAALAVVVALASVRPFDREIRLCEAVGAVEAIRHYGLAADFESLEFWGERLVALAEDERFAGDSEIRLCECTGAARAVLYQGATGDFDALERWGKRVISVVEDERFANNAVFRLQEAAAAASAMERYGEAGNYEGLERWSRRLIAISEDARFAGSVDLTLKEAAGAVCAVLCCGRRADFRGLEWWGARVIAIVDDDRFSGNAEIRLYEAMTALNAAQCYGAAAQFEDFERWARRLINIAGDEKFSGDAEIRRHEAMCAVNAIDLYGAAGDFEALEQWGGRLIAVAEDERFAAIPEIRLEEAMGGANAINRYGAARCFEALERWGRRLTALGDDERFAGNAIIRHAEASGAYNALTHYGSAAEFKDLERWGNRLAAIAERFAAYGEIRQIQGMAATNAINDYGAANRSDWPVARLWRKRLAHLALSAPIDPVVQELAGRFGLTAASQRSGGYPFGRPA